MSGLLPNIDWGGLPVVRGLLADLSPKSWRVVIEGRGSHFFAWLISNRDEGTPKLKSNLNLLLTRQCGLMKLSLGRLSGILGSLSWALRPIC